MWLRLARECRQGERFFKRWFAKSFVYRFP
jgi:hypothetical protein